MPRSTHQQVIDNATTMIEVWPTLLSTARGMAKQAEDAGYPPHIARAISLMVLGITVHLSADDFRENV